MAFRVDITLPALVEAEDYVRFIRDVKRSLRLQRHLKRWRAMEGPGREVFFVQQHVPGRLGQSDFTYMNELGITMTGLGVGLHRHCFHDGRGLGLGKLDHGSRTSKRHPARATQWAAEDRAR
ncbi:MAG: hypothetical protein JJE04_16620 [Acidobacteriia bacterium]|nr:hypothetical protein [Terriglobia bacterium]